MRHPNPVRLKPDLRNPVAKQSALIAVGALLVLLISVAAPGIAIPSPRVRLPVVIAAVDIMVVALLVARGLDVRMLLFLAALPLFAAARALPAMVMTIATELVNARTVVPICSAMGFAFVLRATECDLHLVRLLVRPLRRARWLLVPGGIMAGYLVNTTIVSQAGTAAVLGPILVPLLKAGGLGSVSAGAILLLGASMGGELFNPGAVEMTKLAELTGVRSNEVVWRSAPLNLLACAGALAAFWALSAVRERAPTATQRAAEPQETGAIPVNWLKATVPLLPLLLLAFDARFGPTVLTRQLSGPGRILGAMLCGVIAAGLASRRSARGLSAAFFEGAGYAYNHVISLIVVATTFAAGIERSGLIKLSIGWLAPYPTAAILVAALAPCGLAIISGTGIAPAVAIMEFFVPSAAAMGIDPIRLGTLTAMGAHFGRTMSPAAAVVMMAARLSDAPALDLVRRVSVPLLCGGALLLAAVLAGFL
jgi:C4-dicarboxylate transporter, DcuC family